MKEPLNGALFTSDKMYRYMLIRRWNDGPAAMCIGLNPSTANEETDDPTITNLKSILKTLGFGALYMANLFSLVSSKPEKLRECPDPVSINDDVLIHYKQFVETIIFCWGNFPMAQYRAKVIVPMFPDAKCFGKNRNGTPMHPLALMYNGTVKQPKLITYA